MKVIRTIEEMRTDLAALRRERGSGQDGTVGLVPTMGFLHEGHGSLITRAGEENDIVVISIFVNPLQFGPNEDFERYPRDEERDMALAREKGADIVFMPTVKEMYPTPSKTKVAVTDVTDRLCGASRPGHFDGVATVVSKLFHIVDPDAAYFGMKDAQQVAVIQTMVRDLNMRVRIVPCPTLRQEDGLALSSRNVYLSREEREQALVLSRSLARAEEWLAEAGGNPSRLRDRVEAAIRMSPLADIDYVDVLSYPSLLPPGEWSADMPDNEMLIALAVRFGRTRLIDNRLLPMARE